MMMFNCGTIRMTFTKRAKRNALTTLENDANDCASSNARSAISPPKPTRTVTKSNMFQLLCLPVKKVITGGSQYTVNLITISNKKRYMKVDSTSLIQLGELSTIV